MFEIREDILEEYAALAVKTGVNVQECIFRMNKAGMNLASVPAILFNDATSTVFSTTIIS